MAVSKSKKSSNSTEELELLKTDVASFASSLGLSSSLLSSSSGFNDVDFRKTGPIRPSKLPQKNQKQSENSNLTENQNPRDHRNEKPKPKHPFLSLENGNGDKPLGFEKLKNFPKLPLVKASVLGVWYVDQEELEAKVLGKEKKKVEARDLSEWKSFVEKKRELGERLMAQYAKDYESLRGRSGNIC